MRKIRTMILLSIVCTLLLTGCNNSSKNNEEQLLKVYSFSGENEYISVSNGIIILENQEEICYGGDLKVMSDDFNDITKYSTTIYINGNKKDPLLSKNVNDQTGGTLNVNGKIGIISGDVFKENELNQLNEDLWLELKTINMDGKQKTYTLPLKTIEITEEVKK